MGIRFEDLPLKAQQQAARKLAEEERRKFEARASKYNNQKDTRTGEGGKTLHFDSRKEARRFDELMEMGRAGLIRGLKLQPQFTLQEAYTTTEGVRVRAIRYQADFSYERYRKIQNAEPCGVWEPVVEDVKSKPTRTRVYLMKKKLMLEKLGIEIIEV